MSSEAALPLSDLIVVELGTSAAGPIACQILAELGAKVFKIEPPNGGDDARQWGPPFVAGAAAVFNAINRNKASAAVDFKQEGERALLRQFITEQADILLQNLRPGLVETLGLDAAVLRKEKPSLIYCNLGAFGSVGPLRNMPGYDPLMQACGGIMSITGDDGRAPVRVGPPIVDQGAGMWAAIGILAALHRRTATGEGCEVGTSLYETSVHWIAMHAAAFQASKKVPRRLGTENPTIVPFKAFEAGDGWLIIGAGNDRLFRLLANCFDRAEWADDPQFRNNPDRVRNRDVLNSLIAEIVANKSREYWQQKFNDAGVPCAPVLTVDQVMADPQFAALEMLQSAPDGSIALIGLPLSFNGVRPPFRSLPPPLGSHSSAILDPSPK